MSFHTVVVTLGVHAARGGKICLDSGCPNAGHATGRGVLLG